MKRSAALVACGFALALLVIAFAARGDGDAYSRALAITRGLGFLSFACLCLALCVTPLARLLGYRRQLDPREVRALRRSLGLAAAGSALCHAALSLAAVRGTLQNLWSTPSLRAGLAAAIVLLLLGASSFDRVVRALRMRRWKELHRLAYFAFGCASWHALLRPFAPLGVLLAICSATLAIGLFRWIPARRAREEDAP